MMSNNNNNSEFYDANSPLDNSVLEDKSSIDIEEDIPLCDSCKNVILKPYKDHKLICSVCLRIYDPHYEIIQIQDQETTLDELSSRGEMTFKDEADKPIRKTLNHSSAEIEDNLEYVKREFERYRQTEIVDKDTITALNKTRKRSSQQ